MMVRLWGDHSESRGDTMVRNHDQTMVRTWGDHGGVTMVGPGVTRVVGHRENMMVRPWVDTSQTIA